jgi:hypothetical protein
MTAPTDRTPTADDLVNVPRRCESCGRFVSKRHPRTVRHYYDIDFAKPVIVYSLATATKRQERLDCPACSMPCFLMHEAERGQGIVIGDSIPGGWEYCDPQTTQADYKAAS